VTFLALVVSVQTYNMYLETAPDRPTIYQDVQILVAPSTNTTACIDYYVNSWHDDYSAPPSPEISTGGDYDADQVDSQ
jgi:hypothetical protein